MRALDGAVGDADVRFQALNKELDGIFRSRPIEEWSVRLDAEGCIYGVLYIGSISASPTAYLLRGYGRAGTQNDLAEAVILSTGWFCEAGGRGPHPRGW